MRKTGQAALALVLGIAGLPLFAQTLVDPDLEVETIFPCCPSSHVSMAFVGEDDILVTFRGTGHVRRVLNGVLGQDPVLDVAVHFSSERGLLGIATDPDFVNNGYVYLYYTQSPTGDDTDDGADIPLGNRVYRYTWDGAALVHPVLILDLPAVPGPNHDGGLIRFGPDDRMYVVIGDLNVFGKLSNISNGPDPNDAGVILRVDTAGRALPDNPFFDPADPTNPLGRYYAYGVRNSFGMDFDPLSGELWITENGTGQFDEINRVTRGMNGGWAHILGPDALDPDDEADLWWVPGAHYVDPEFSWSAPVAPTGIAFIDSPKLGCDHRYDVLVGDHNCGNLYRFEVDAAREELTFVAAELLDRVADNDTDLCNGELSEVLFGTGFGIITDIRPGPDGRIYINSLGHRSLYRISLAPGAVTDVDGDEVDDACDCDPSDPGAFAAPVEVPRTRVSKGATTTLGWDSQRGTAGDATGSTVASGSLSLLRTQAGFASACVLARDLVEPRLDDTRVDPPAGDGYYYLVRSANGCGSGTYGDGTSAPDARDALDSAAPPDCS